MNRECYGCSVSFDDTHEAVSRVGITYNRKHESTSSDETYCPRCTMKIEEVDKNILHDQFQGLVKAAIAHNPSKTKVSISESLVREIARNLGASYRLSDALVERIFWANWTGAPPESSGLVMNKYSNRDRLVAFVAEKLKDLWTLES